jgi:hypothetical protein
MHESQHDVSVCSHRFEGSIGASCEIDDDCMHSSGSSRIKGGVCTEGKCACNLCAAGTDCKVVKQSKAGKANGVRLVLNMAIEQDAAIYSAKNSRWASGATIFLHSRLDDMNSGTRVLAPPSMVTDVSISQGVTKETNFPYTTA